VWGSSEIFLGQALGGVARERVGDRLLDDLFVGRRCGERRAKILAGNE
jgi:hypothetical protein